MNQQTEYLSNGGNRCPNCGGESIDSKMPEFDDTIHNGHDELIAEVKCAECGATWKERYTLCGFEDLRVPPRNDVQTYEVQLNSQWKTKEQP